MLNREYRGAFFIDSSNPDVIARWDKTGLVRGVTTNPKIMLNDGVTSEDYRPTIEKICGLMGTRPVSVELMDSRASVDDMLYEARDLASISRENITIKVPLITDKPEECLEVMHRLAVEEGIPVNATVGMTFEGLTMMAGALRGTEVSSYVSQFYCRGEEDWNIRGKPDYSPDGLKVGDGAEVNSSPARLTRGIVRYLESDSGLMRVSLIVGSIRGASHVGEALEAGAHIVTVTPPVLDAMVYSRRGAETVRDFDKDAMEVRGR